MLTQTAQLKSGFIFNIQRNLQNKLSVDRSDEKLQCVRVKKHMQVLNVYPGGAWQLTSSYFSCGLTKFSRKSVCPKLTSLCSSSFDHDAIFLLNNEIFGELICRIKQIDASQRVYQHKSRFTVCGKCPSLSSPKFKDTAMYF